MFKCHWWLILVFCGSATCTVHQNCANVWFMPKIFFIWIHDFSLHAAYDLKILNLCNKNLYAKTFSISWTLYCRDIQYFLHITICQNDYGTPRAINGLYMILYDIDLCFTQCQTREKIIYLGGLYVSLHYQTNIHFHFSR